MNGSRIAQNMPNKADPSEAALFQARWASGRYHHRRWFSANRCLDVRLTSGALHTRLMFPFSLFSATHRGFKNTIPLMQIKAVQKARFMGWWETVEITFVDNEGCSRCLEIGFTGPLPQIGTHQQKTRDAFMQAMQEALEATD